MILVRFNFNEVYNFAMWKLLVSNQLHGLMLAFSKTTFAPPKKRRLPPKILEKNNRENNRNNSLLSQNNDLLSFAPLKFCSSRKPAWEVTVLGANLWAAYFTKRKVSGAKDHGKIYIRVRPPLLRHFAQFSILWAKESALNGRYR